MASSSSRPVAAQKIKMITNSNEVLQDCGCMTNRRAKCTEKFRSEASKADTTVSNIQIKQGGLNHDDAAKPGHKRGGCVNIYHLKCHFKQPFYSSAFIMVTYTTEPIHYQIGERDFSILALLAAFIPSMENTEMLSYLVC